MVSHLRYAPGTRPGREVTGGRGAEERAGESDDDEGPPPLEELAQVGENCTVQVRGTAEHLVH